MVVSGQVDIDVMSYEANCTLAQSDTVEIAAIVKTSQTYPSFGIMASYPMSDSTTVPA